jgi:hypothetical protein
VRPEHPAGLLLGFLDGAGEAHAALVARVGFLEVALAAAARVDLRLDHPDGAVDLAGGGLGILRPQDGAAVETGQPAARRSSLA